MRVLVTGGYGLIGSAILARLQREGHSLVGAGRSIEQAQRRFPYARWVEADFRNLTSADAWGPLLDDVDAVVNCVGVLQDSGRDDTRRVHVEATCALFDACERAMTRRVVHLSAIGAELAAATKFARTKAEADAHLASLDLDWVILRPALVMSPAVYGGSAMLRGLAAFPLMTPVIRAESRIQVVSIDDVAETVAFALKPGAPAKVRWEVAHPQILTLGEIITRIRAWLRLPPAAARARDDNRWQDRECGCRRPGLARLAQPGALDRTGAACRGCCWGAEGLDGGDRHHAAKF